MGIEGRMQVVQGDITQLEVDAVVNAANAQLEPGGGVCGAIHKAAGPQLAKECKKLGGCPPGDACITKAYRLPARHVIHAVGPVWHGGNQGEDAMLVSCYRRALDLAMQNDVESLAFPAISTGAYGFPVDRAAHIAVRTVGDFLEVSDTPRTVLFCTHSTPDRQVYLKTLQGRR